jgi:hypothetical protein
MEVDFNNIGQLNFNLKCKCANLAHTLVVQITIDNVKLHSITIFNYEMDLKL